MLRRELSDTVTERQAFETRLQQLRAEVRLCEASYEVLAQRERWLLQEVTSALDLRHASQGEGEPSTSLEDFLAGGGARPSRGLAGSGGPVFFELEGDASMDPNLDADAGGSTGSGAGAKAGPVAIDFSDSEGGDGGYGSGGDMEEVLDHVGVARCRQCGLRLPLDVAAIEEHCRSCYGNAALSEAKAAEEEALKQGLYGRCCHCGEVLPLTDEGVERHVCRGGSASATRGSAEKSGGQPAPAAGAAAAAAVAAAAGGASAGAEAAGAAAGTAVGAGGARGATGAGAAAAPAPARDLPLGPLRPGGGARLEGGSPRSGPAASPPRSARSGGALRGWFRSPPKGSPTRAEGVSPQHSG